MFGEAGCVTEDIMTRRVAIIGSGWVGSSVAQATLQLGAADELLLYDVRLELAEGEAMDLAHGASFYPTASVRIATIEEMTDADAIVISAGRGGRPDESRLALLRDNAAIIREIGRRLVGCRGVIVMVTNPVDVLTHVMVEASGLPPARVVGTGTMLDTARLRQVLGRVLRLDPHSVHAQVVGEHGDSEVVLWSGARVGGVPLRSWPGWNQEQERLLAEEVRTAAYQIIRRKGATNHAVGLVTAELLRCMLRGERRVLTVSRLQDGAGGLRGVTLSMPTIVGAEGAIQVLEPEMSPDERERLEQSADVIRKAFKQLNPV
jgi:L-lactate dehydrogenase